MSLTITGIAVSLVGTLLLKFGFSEACSSEIIQNTPLVIGSLVAYWGRIRQGDVNFLGVKK